MKIALYNKSDKLLSAYVSQFIGERGGCVNVCIIYRHFRNYKLIFI